MTSPASTPPSLAKSSSAASESALSRLLIAPLSFLAFLLSLALIENRNSSLRTHIHGPSPPLPLPHTIYGRAKGTVHRWVYRPAPYAYVRSPAALEREKSAPPVPAGPVSKDEPWHWHTKQRKMMSMEFEDAFAMRKRVVVVMGAAFLGVAAGAVWIVRWGWGVFWGIF